MAVLTPPRPDLLAYREATTLEFSKLVTELTGILAKMISDHEGPRVVQAWFTGLNPELNDRVPVRLLREENVEIAGPELLGAARAFLAGG